MIMSVRWIKLICVIFCVINIIGDNNCTGDDTSGEAGAEPQLDNSNTQTIQDSNNNIDAQELPQTDTQQDDLNQQQDTSQSSSVSVANEGNSQNIETDKTDVINNEAGIDIENNNAQTRNSNVDTAHDTSNDNIGSNVNDGQEQKNGEIEPETRNSFSSLQPFGSDSIKNNVQTHYPETNEQNSFDFEVFKEGSSKASSAKDDNSSGLKFSGGDDSGESVSNIKETRDAKYKALDNNNMADLNGYDMSTDSQTETVAIKVSKDPNDSDDSNDNSDDSDNKKDSQIVQTDQSDKNTQENARWPTFSYTHTSFDKNENNNAEMLQTNNKLKTPVFRIDQGFVQEGNFWSKLTNGDSGEQVEQTLGRKLFKIDRANLLLNRNDNYRRSGDGNSFTNFYQEQPLIDNNKESKSWIRSFQQSSDDSDERNHERNSHNNENRNPINNFERRYNIKHESDSVEQNINIRNTNERQFRKRKRGQRLNSHHNTYSDSDYVFNDDSDLLNSDISSEENVENIDTSSPCNNMDIIFVIDSSDDVTDTEFQFVKHTLAKLTPAVLGSNNNVRIGAVVYGSRITKMISLSNNATSLVRSFQEITPSKGHNKPYLGILAGRGAFLSSIGTIKVIAFVASGFQQYTKLAAEQAMLAKRDGIRVVGIGYGDLALKEDFTEVSSTRYMVSIYKNAVELYERAEKLPSDICRVPTFKRKQDESSESDDIVTSETTESSQTDETEGDNNYFGNFGESSYNDDSKTKDDENDIFDDDNNRDTADGVVKGKDSSDDSGTSRSSDDDDESNLSDSESTALNNYEGDISIATDLDDSSDSSDSDKSSSGEKEWSEQTPEEKCENSKMVHGVGYKRHKTDCDRFIQCYYDEFGITRASTKTCPFGQYWDHFHVACVESNLANCPNDPCKATGQTSRVNSDSCRAYWGCRNDQSIIQCCPENMSFQPGKGCIHDPSCTGFCHPNDGPESGSCDKKPLFGKPYLYRQWIESGHWVEMLCPPGTLFDENDCGCTMRTTLLTSLGVRAVASETCRPELYLPFCQGLKDWSGRNTLVQNPEDKVLVLDGKAYFNGEASLFIPRFSGVSYGETIYIKLRYKPDFSDDTPSTNVVTGTNDDSIFVKRFKRSLLTRRRRDSDTTTTGNGMSESIADNGNRNMDNPSQYLTDVSQQLISDQFSAANIENDGQNGDKTSTKSFQDNHQAERKINTDSSVNNQEDQSTMQENTAETMQSSNTEIAESSPFGQNAKQSSVSDVSQVSMDNINQQEIVEHGLEDKLTPIVAEGESLTPAIQSNDNTESTSSGTQESTTEVDKLENNAVNVVESHDTVLDQENKSLKSTLADHSSGILEKDDGLTTGSSKNDDNAASDSADSDSSDQYLSVFETSQFDDRRKSDLDYELSQTHTDKDQFSASDSTNSGKSRSYFNDWFQNNDGNKDIIIGEQQSLSHSQTRQGGESGEGYFNDWFEKTKEHSKIEGQDNNLQRNDDTNGEQGGQNLDFSKKNEYNSDQTPTSKLRWTEGDLYKDYSSDIDAFEENVDLYQSNNKEKSSQINENKRHQMNELGEYQEENNNLTHNYNNYIARGEVEGLLLKGNMNVEDINSKGSNGPNTGLYIQTSESRNNQYNMRTRNINNNVDTYEARRMLASKRLEGQDQTITSNEPTTFLSDREGQANKKEHSMTLISNAACQIPDQDKCLEDPSLFIGTGRNSTTFSVYATESKTTTVNLRKSEESIDGWRTAIFTVKDGVFRVFDQESTDFEPISGPVKTTFSGIYIGQGTRMKNFKGYIDEVYVYLCQPSDLESFMSRDFQEKESNSDDTCDYINRDIVKHYDNNSSEETIGEPVVPWWGR